MNLADNPASEMVNNDILEEALRPLELALEAARMGIWNWDLGTNTVTITSGRGPITGLPRECQPSTFESFLEIVHREDRGKVVKEVRQALEEGGEYRAEFRAAQPDGSYRWTAARGRVFRDAQGKPLAMAGVEFDISERKQAEEALHKNRQMLAAAQALANLGSFEWNVSQNQVFLSDELYRILGLQPQVPPPTFEAMIEHVHPEDRNRVRQTIAKSLKENKPFRMKERILRPGGQVRFLDGQGQVIQDDQGTRIIGFCQDITERHHGENAMREALLAFRDLFESSPDAIFVEDLEGNVLDVNPAACRLHGFTRGELLSKNAMDLVPPDHRPLVAHRFSQMVRGELDHVEGFSWTQEGRTVPVELRVNRFSYADRPALLIHVRDLTERKRLEEQFQQAQKMEAIGRLAGGVAHDFNNLLTVINGHSAILLQELLPGHPLRSSLEQIHQAGERAAGVTRQLLAFGRKQILQPVVLDLNRIVAQVEDLLRHLLGEDILLTTTLDPNLPWIKADPTQIEQVIINLAVNARDAMPRGGRLALATARVETGGNADMTAGRYAVLSVSDTGSGMDADILNHIFEPFFTTKEVGKGTGLGLATVYGIVKQSGGHIQVESAPGLGSTFRVFLPAKGEPIPAMPRESRSDAFQGNEVVLLVEDQDQVREVARRMLQGQGYTVLETGQPAEALRISAAHRGTIHLLLTDVVMPGMNGRELAEQLLPLRPDLKVLYLSGNPEDAVLRHGIREGVAFLAKPFTAQVLGRKVREVLDQPVFS